MSPKANEIRAAVQVVVKGVEAIETEGPITTKKLEQMKRTLVENETRATKQK